MHHIYIDLETLPDLAMTPAERAESEASIRARVPKSYKKAETIEKWVGEKMATREAAWLKGSIHSLKARVYVISYAIDDDPVESMWTGYHPDRTASVDEEEGLLVGAFQRTLEARLGAPLHEVPHTFVAHFGATFDFPILRLRAMKYGMHGLARALPSDRWARGADDTALMCGSAGTHGAGFALDECARFFGCQRKTDGMDGSKVYGLWLQGKHEEAAAYCRQDVEVLRDVHRALRMWVR